MNCGTEGQGYHQEMNLAVDSQTSVSLSNALIRALNVNKGE
jgi:hypothetical protein